MANSANHPSTLIYSIRLTAVLGLAAGLLGAVAVFAGDHPQTSEEQQAALTLAIYLGISGWVGFLLLLAVAKVLDLLSIAAPRPEQPSRHKPLVVPELEPAPGPGPEQD